MDRMQSLDLLIWPTEFKSYNNVVTFAFVLISRDAAIPPTALDIGTGDFSIAVPIAGLNTNTRKIRANTTALTPAASLKANSKTHG